MIVVSCQEMERLKTARNTQGRVLHPMFDKERCQHDVLATTNNDGL